MKWRTPTRWTPPSALGTILFGFTTNLRSASPRFPAARLSRLSFLSSKSSMRKTLSLARFPACQQRSTRPAILTLPAQCTCGIASSLISQSATRLFPYASLFSFSFHSTFSSMSTSRLFFALGPKPVRHPFSLAFSHLYL